MEAVKIKDNSVLINPIPLDEFNLDNLHYLFERAKDKVKKELVLKLVEEANISQDLTGESEETKLESWNKIKDKF